MINTNAKWDTFKIMVSLVEQCLFIHIGLTHYSYCYLDELNEKIQKLGNDYATALSWLKGAKNDFENETKKLDELQRQYEHFESELDEISRNRLENNDVLIKIHKEIMEQNAKVERAKRELKIAKKALIKKVEDREYVRLLEVDHIIQIFLDLFLLISNEFAFSERCNSQRA